jgi:hypothetical protein
MANRINVFSRNPINAAKGSAYGPSRKRDSFLESFRVGFGVVLMQLLYVIGASTPEAPIRCCSRQDKYVSGINLRRQL